MLEICCASLEDALAAQRGGADRVELCEELDVGGVTPEVELLQAVKSKVDLPVFALVRCRAGDFVFDEEEVAAMTGCIALLREAGADGIVCGALDRDGAIDRAATERFVAAARPLPFTFHRAFDACVDHFGALPILRELGARRVLTSAGQRCAADDPGLLAEIARAADGAPLVLACGGLRSHNARALAAVDGLAEFHSAARAPGGEGVDEAEVRRLAEIFAA